MTYDDVAFAGEPTEERDASEVAEAIASGWPGDQVPEVAFTSARSLDRDLRTWFTVVERGPPKCLSLRDADVGEVASLKAFVKLHFFEGVFVIAGADPGVRYPPVGGSWPFR